MTTAKKTPSSTTKKASSAKTKTTAKKAAPKKTATVKKAASAKAATAKKTTVKKTAEAKSAKTAVKKVQSPYPESVQSAARILFELRAQRLELIDLRGISETSDFMLVSTCESEAQMQAILDELSKEFKAKKLPHRTEYKPGINMRWAVFDAGFDLMVQLFEESKREELSLDKLYSDAKITLLDEKDFIQAKKKKVQAEDELV